MILRKDKNIDINKWLHLLSISAYATPFQAPDFYNFYNSIDGSYSNVFAVEEDGVYTSLVVVTVQKEKGIKSIFSTRGIIYGGPILTNAKNNSLSFLVKQVTSYYRKELIYIEIRNNHEYSQYIRSFANLNWKYKAHLNVQLNIENMNLDEVLSHMKYNRRREIRISLKEGATVEESIDENENLILFKLLKKTYSEKVKLPLPSFQFFSQLSASEVGKVYIVKHKETVIGGAYCVLDRNIINTLYYVGLREYHKKIFPTHLAVLGVIEYAIQNKLKLVDFMGAGTPGKDYGVRDYKLQFGGKLVEHGRFLHVFKPLLFNVGKLGLKILSYF